MWSAIADFFGGFWVKFGLITAAIIAIGGTAAYGYHRFELSFTQETEISDLKTALTTQHDADEKAIKDLKAAQKLEITAITKEKNDALQTQQEALQEINKLAKTSAVDDGPTRAVLSDTLKWLRERPANRNIDRGSKGAPAGGTSNTASNSSGS